MIYSSELEIVKCCKMDETRFKKGYCIVLNDSVKKTGFDTKKDAINWINECITNNTIIKG